MTSADSKPTIITICGIEVDLFEPTFSVIKIDDIALALSKICRFIGHVNQFYSVAQHSVLVSQNCVEIDALWGLLHDASEAYLGDISSPLKKLIPRYSTLESRMQRTITDNFGLHPEMPFSVKNADRKMLATEGRDLCHPSWPFQDLGVVPIKEKIIPLNPDDAKDLFLDRYTELTGL